MPKPIREQEKRERGRPVEYPLPPSIPDTPENVMRAIVMTPPKRADEWNYIRESGRGQKRS